MSGLLSEAWCASATSALADAADDGQPVGAPESAAEVEFVVSGEGDTVRTRWVVEGGRLVAVRPVGEGDETPAATVPQSREDHEAMVAGDLDPAVAFMRGDLKPEGSAAAVLALVSALNRPEARAALRSA